MGKQRSKSLPERAIRISTYAELDKSLFRADPPTARRPAPRPLDSAARLARAFSTTAMQEASSSALARQASAASIWASRAVWSSS